ncbi:twin-arginine translocase TatA/TatE family subunit [Candidatus Acetothermia bacterium]|nr:twin-arginine translocase TatA/TatE family subunit [Candidatus Acetothermia bacterium]MBI3642497.1 twin-arginine translocase TatA/TatE family subunit [Candidatus Acetothermia bacterium]
MFFANPAEWIPILLIVLLLFGGKKLPELARSLGQAQRAFREESNKLKRDIEAESAKEEMKSADVASQPKAAPATAQSGASTNSGSSGQKS